MEQLTNQVKFQFNETNNKGEAQVNISAKEICFLHAVTDKPGAEFDISIEDMVGNVQFEKKGCKNPTNRWGERINLPLTDNSLKVKISNMKGATEMNVFLE